MRALDRELRVKITDIINRKLKAMQVGESGGADFVGFLLESNQTAGHRKKCRIEHLRFLCCVANCSIGQGNIRLWSSGQASS